MSAQLLHFNGATYKASRDHARLTDQYWRVFALMHDTRWRTLTEIARATGDPEASVSARLRDLRKPRFGGHLVQAKCVGRGMWVYRLFTRPTRDEAAALLK